uniref:Uncharacterized protein n=2 Tax=Esox lucius TaxID=8010 RepID=A0A3P8XXX5_ESOLU
METLNEMDDLCTSGFGTPQPRHGLQLLHWFANEYVKIVTNGEVEIERNPNKKAFGCQQFTDNTDTKYRLLPNRLLPFYMLGNLDAPGAEDLPDYVSKNHTEKNNVSNKDRIIFSLQPDKVLDRIYVTQHDHRSGAFDPQRTFRISKGLIKTISRLDLDELLEKTGYSLPRPSPMDTLNEMRHLTSSEFGRPWPRHGLHLLHWFSNDYVTIYDDGDIMTERNLNKKAFGFHPFHDNDQLLPDRGFPFYEVGNLGAPKADELLGYIRENYTGKNDDSNIDRIIISLQPDKVLDRIYVTQHDH